MWLQYATVSTKLSVAESRIFSLSGDEIGKNMAFYVIVILPILFCFQSLTLSAKLIFEHQILALFYEKIVFQG